MKTLNLFIGFLVSIFIGCLFLLLAALTGSEKFTYGILAAVVMVTFAFLFSANIFAQRK